MSRFIGVPPKFRQHRARVEGGVSPLLYMTKVSGLLRQCTEHQCEAGISAFQVAQCLMVARFLVECRLQIQAGACWNF
jgi:hypothetical protein